MNVRWTMKRQSASRTRFGSALPNFTQTTMVSATVSHTLDFESAPINSQRDNPNPNQSTPNVITLTNQLPTRTDLGNAEVVFENATKEEFRFVDDVAQVGAACIVVPCGDAMWASEQI